ncbi:hypothetical protein EOL73_03085 [Candidatus Saccharibacteria bacterium]|nr:hypothetical protein [Candidatus Saccharibacteria bacterium]
MQSARSWLGLQNIRLSLADWSLLPVPVLLFFSYHPVIPVAQGVYRTNYEFSILELYLVLFVFLNLALIWQARRKILVNMGARLATVFGLYSTLSILWSPDVLRAIVTSGLIWILIFTFYSLLANKNLPKLVESLVRIFIVASVFVSFFAFYQMAAASIPALSDSAFLCAGCQANQFGFARPNGFAIEPQFLGSLLMAPILLLVHFTIVKKQSLLTYVVLGILLTAFFLTLSRGAIFSLALGVVILALVYRSRFKHIFASLGVIFASFVIALVIQGTAAQFNPTTSVTFSQAIAVSIHQLSLGVVDFRATPVVVTETPASSEPVKPGDPALFEGYVERSTSERVEASCLALGTWTQSPAHTLFGAGIAGTGYFFETQPTRSTAPWCKTNI